MGTERHDDGPPDSLRAATETLRTRRHAELLFDAVAAHLGDAAWRETVNDGAIRRLFRRDRSQPTQLVPWLVLQLSFGSRVIITPDWMEAGGEALAEPSSSSEPPSKLRGLGPGEIRLVDGTEHIEIAYDEQGTKFEWVRSHHPQPLAGLAKALAAGSENAIELLARYLATLDPGRHGPGRVLMPVALPHGAGSVWQCGLRALRRVLFDNGAARSGSWAVADGLTGKALAFGATQDEALATWRDAVAADPPWPVPRPTPEPPDELPPGTIIMRAPSPDVPMPDAIPQNVPAAIVRLGAEPDAPPPFGSWVPLLGARGTTSFAACRRKRDGFTLIGQGVIGVVDFDRLTAEMDRVDEEHEARFREVVANTPGGVQRWPCRTTTYRVLDGGRLQADDATESPSWQGGELDGDVVQERVVRQRWVPKERRSEDA